jgi:hypothetical protein
MLIVISNSGHQSADSGGENETGLVRFTIQGPTLYLFNYLINFYVVIVVTLLFAE